VRLLIWLNATITSLLSAGTIWLTAQLYKAFGTSLVSLHKNNKINLWWLSSRILRRLIWTVIALIMEAACTSETSVNFYQTTWLSNTKDSHLNILRCKKLKSHNNINLPTLNHFQPGAGKWQSCSTLLVDTQWLWSSRFHVFWKLCITEKEAEQCDSLSSFRTSCLMATTLNAALNC
jgi:hypothetical protein